jgi:hypothetical protein
MRGRKVRIPALALAVLCGGVVAPPARAVSTQVWKHRTLSEREEGDLKGVSLASDGTLILGPALESLAMSADPYFWALARDSKGRIYAGGGNDGKVYRLEKGGRLTLFFDSPEMEVHALAVDSRDDLYVGTSPRGKIYRVTPAGKATEFFDPGETYIWSLVFDRKGNLYAGTGTDGKIYRIAESGKGEVFLDTDETHVRVLALDPAGGLIAGTDGKGLVLRISPDGTSRVLTDSPLNEVTAIAVAPQGGAVYYSTAGQAAARGGALRSPVQPPQGHEPSKPTSPGSEGERPPGQPPPPPQQQPGEQKTAAPPAPPAGAGVESKILAVEADGYSREIWSGTGDLILSLALDSRGRVTAGAGVNGKIYRIDPSTTETTLLAMADSAQITALLPEGGGAIIAAGSNLGALYRLGGKVAEEGTFETAPFDARVYSSWGNLEWKGESPPGSSLGIQVRTGSTPDPDSTWSGWSAIQEKPRALIQAPRGRFVQWRAILKSKDGRTTPRLREVDVSYLQRNLPPELKAVEVQSPGVVFQRPNKSGGATAAPAEGSSGPGRGAEGQRPPRRRPQQPRPQNETDGRAAQWTALDPNGDDLQYAVYYRGVDEQEWKLMEKDLTDPFFSWDATSLADGTYILKVVADDSPENPPEVALSAERLSEPFDIDNNPPVIGPIRTSTAGSTARLEFEVSDSFSNVGSVEYSINAGEWRLLYPVDGINDSTREEYRVDLPGLPPGEVSVVVRANDAAGNSSTARANVRMTGGR